MGAGVLILGGACGYIPVSVCLQLRVVVRYWEQVGREESRVLVMSMFVVRHSCRCV